MMTRLILVLVLLLAACGGSKSPSADGYVAEYGGSAAVYSDILSGTNCAALQVTFDQAAGNNDTAERGSAEATWTTGYMAAADERMQAIGCY